MLQHCYLVLLFFPYGRKSFFAAFSLGRSQSTSRHEPHIPSKKFNMCHFHASTQGFIAKAGIVCEHIKFVAIGSHIVDFPNLLAKSGPVFG